MCLRLKLSLNTRPLAKVLERNAKDSLISWKFQPWWCCCARLALPDHSLCSTSSCLSLPCCGPDLCGKDTEVINKSWLFTLFFLLISMCNCWQQWKHRLCISFPYVHSYSSWWTVTDPLSYCVVLRMRSIKSSKWIIIVTLSEGSRLHFIPLFYHWRVKKVIPERSVLTTWFLQRSPHHQLLTPLRVFHARQLKSRSMSPISRYAATA